MNPLVITGILAVTVASFAMMVSFSDEQMRHSDMSERMAEMNAQRVREDVSAVLAGEQLSLENTGPVPVLIKEIRVLDGSGHIVSRQKTDVAVSTAQTGTIQLDGNMSRAIRSMSG